MSESVQQQIDSMVNEAFEQVRIASDEAVKREIKETLMRQIYKLYFNNYESPEATMRRLVEEASKTGNVEVVDETFIKEVKKNIYKIEDIEKIVENRFGLTPLRKQSAKEETDIIVDKIPKINDDAILLNIYDKKVRPRNGLFKMVKSLFVRK